MRERDEKMGGEQDVEQQGAGTPSSGNNRRRATDFVGLRAGAKMMLAGAKEVEERKFYTPERKEKKMY